MNTSNKVSQRIINIFLIAATLAVYWQILQFDFINLDDNAYVYDNPHINNGITTDNIIWAFTTNYLSNWHPLTWISHMLDCQICGMNPGCHHLISLLFHIANTLLLFFIFKQMTPHLWYSGFLAALFALHPLHVESVVWISERKDVLSTFFWMLTIWCYFRYTKYLNVKWYVLVILFYIFGLMSKPMLVTLPFVLLLLDYWPLNRVQTQSSSINAKRMSVLPLVLEKIPLFIFATLSCLVTFYVQNHGGAVASLASISFKTRIANSLISYITYIGKIMYPSHLALLYPHPGMPPIWKAALAFMLLACLSSLAIKNMKKNPSLIIGWLWFLGTLVPVIGLIQVGVQATADRYTYIPSIGFFIIVAFGVPELISQWRLKKIMLSALAIVLIITYMAITHTQAGYWKNSITLFEHTLKVTSKNHLIHYNLGNTLVKQGHTEKAIYHFLQAVKIKPDYLEARFNLGITLYNAGHTEKAIEQYLKILKTKPNFPAARFYLSLALGKKERPDELLNNSKPQSGFN